MEIPGGDPGWRSNQPNLKNKNDEKSKTTARLTERDIFKTIFRLLQV